MNIHHDASSQTVKGTRQRRKRGAERRDYVRKCLEATKGYEGSIKELARRIGLRHSSLNKCYWVNKLADIELYDAVWEGAVPLTKAFRQLVDTTPSPLLTSAQRGAKISVALGTPQSYARSSAAQKARWANSTPEQRAAFSAKGHAAKLAKAKQSKPA
jgi:hypothetical protein